MRTNLFKSINFIRRGSGANLNLFRYATMVLVLLLGMSESAWGASYYSQFTAKSGNTAQGLVYAAGSNSEGGLPSYTNEVTPDKHDGSQGAEYTWYAWAKAARGYQFKTWTKGSNINSNGTLTNAATTFGVKHSSSDYGTTSGDATATFEAATAYTITFKKPENFGAYTAEYANYSISNNAFVDYTKTITMTSSTANTNETSYASDKITLTATARVGNFLGWYNGSTLLSTKADGYSFSPSEAMTIEGRWEDVTTHLNMTFKAVELDDSSNPKGYYTVGGTTVTTSDVVVNTGDIYYLETTLTATPAEGYVFTGWYTKEGKKRNFISYDNPFNAYFDQEMTVYANFSYNNYTDDQKAQFKVGSTPYTDLNAANAAAGGSNKTIVCTRDGILPPGNYTISNGVKLYIPYSSSESSQTTPAVVTTAAGLSVYRKLVMTEGANITVENGGVISVGGQIMSASGGSPSAYPTGACGMIDMSKGGHIELNNGATLYAWGFIKGQDMDQGNNTLDVGTITANSGSNIWEDFWLADWRGGSACSCLAMNDGHMMFPFQGYTMQNIEVPTLYNYGATLNNYINVYGNKKTNAGTFATIGSENTLFLLKDAKSKVCKWYDPTTDLVCYELTGTTQIDALNVDAGITEVSSAGFNLPITSNMHVILNSDITISKPITILPGAVLEIKSGFTATISDNLYMYDTDDWGKGVLGYYFYPFSNLTSHKSRGTGSANDLEDAKLVVDGTLNVTGKIYSTTGGSNIMGNGGGKVTLPSVLYGSPCLYQAWGGASGTQTSTTRTLSYWAASTDTYVEPITVNSANLYNEDGSYTQSAASTTFYNVNGRWFAASAKDEKANHTYDFTYISSGAVSGAGGTNTTTDAVYSNDKTGLEARMKWFNVTADACPNWWHGQGDQSTWFYNWTLESAWHQFMPTSTVGLYSSSNNTLYTKTDCVWKEFGDADVNCLYEIGGIKKALVDGQFIALEPNSDDAAFHEAADPTKYYICFEGCNWHAATKYEGEKKAYVVDETTFIWYEERWMAVEREEPFFYTKDETNVTIYYEYIGSEWVLAQPYVEVTDATETRQLLRFNEAITVASAKKNATIKLLRDFVNITTPMTFTGANTTCTLDLNGYVAEVHVVDVGNKKDYYPKMLTLNGAGTTFTIIDNTTDKKGELKLIASCSSETNTYRWSGIYVQNGSLVLQSGKVYVEHPFAWVSNSNTGFIRGILVASAKTFTMNGGTLAVVSDYNTYGIESASGTPTVNINHGTIECIATKKDSPYGIIGYGTINIKNDSYIHVNAKANTSARGVSVSAGSSYQGTVNVTGGTIYAEATGSAQGIYCSGTATVTGDYNATTPNNTPKTRYYAKANISGGTITAICRTSSTSYGVLSYGTTTISGGTITSTVQKSDQNTAYGVYTAGGTTTISAGANIIANAPTKAYGVTATAANGDSNRGWPHVGVVNITGGTITANTTNTTTAYGLLVTGATWTINKTNSYSVFNGDYAAAGTATVTGGTFNANAKTTLARGIAVAATKTKNDASATPQCTINGGYYQMTGTGDVLGCNASALAADFHINGGYYSHDGNLATYTPSPKHVLTLASGDANRPPYYYKVAEAYQVTFKTEDGTANIIDPIYQEVNTKPVCSTEPTKASTSTNSFTFDGWATAANGNKAYEPDGLPNVTSAGATYYAHFATTTLKYRVHLDATTNGGECATENIYVNPGAAVGTLPTATKYGYTFSGWFTAATGGTQLAATTVINANADYYAHFTVNSHTLTWDLDGGKVSTAGKIGSTTWPAKNATGTQSRSVAYGTVLTTIPVVTKTGYVFNRWDPVPTSSMPDNDVTYTALWNPATNTKYYVKHYQQNIDDDNYTLVETDNLTGTTDATVTPARKSYDGFLSPAPQQLTIGAAGTSELVYNYDRVVYTINWNASANGGACATASTDVRHGATIALPTATKAGHILEGWYTKAEGGNKISDGAAVLQNYGTLYAQFIPTYTIIWNDENGNELSREEKLIGESLTPPDYSKEDTQEWDYTFHGWNDGTTTYEANAIPAVSGAATYTADVKKVKNNYTLTIGVVEAGYGSVNGTSVTVPYGTSVSTSDNVLTIGTTTVTATPTASNAQYTYTFSTWHNVPTSVTGNVDNIQAVFTRTLNTVTVTWKNEDGTPLETDENVEFGATPTYDGATPIKETDENFGYTFDGWDDGTTVYAADALPIVSGAVTYTAHYSTAPTVASVKVGINTRYYTDFAEAWEATNSATGEVTLKLLQEVSGITTSLAYTNAQNCTLDLNNHLLKGAVNQKLLDINKAGCTFTITDSSAEQGGELYNEASGEVRYYGVYLTAGTLNLEAGTVHAQNLKSNYSSATTAAKRCMASGVYVASGQRFNMNGGIVTGEAIYAAYGVESAGVIVINNGTINATTTKFTVAGGIVCSGTTTINSGTINATAKTSTTYGIYVNGGTTTIKGGEIEAKTTTKNCYGLYVKSGALTIPSASTVEISATATTSGAYGVYVAASKTATIEAGTFTVTAGTSSAAGVNSLGTTTIKGGTFNVSAASTTSTLTTVPCGIYATRGTVTVTGNPTFNVTSGATRAFGAFAYGTIGAKGTDKYSGTININGGTFNVTSTTTTAYGVYAGLYGLNIVQKTENAGDTIFGQHYMPGIISITDGTFNVKAKTTKAYALVLSKELNESGTVGTTLRSPKITVTGGKFKVESAGDANATAYAISSSNNSSQATMQGGWYSVNANLSRYVEPEKSCNYHVLDLTGEDPYLYVVAEAYTVTFNENGHGSAPASQVIEKNQHATQPTAPSATGYTFGGWYKEAGCANAWNFASNTVTIATTLYAKWTPVEYSITYNNLEGASNSNPANYTIESDNITLANPGDRAGYDFGGWYTNEDLTTPAGTPAITTGSIGNKTFYAKWTLKTYAITYNKGANGTGTVTAGSKTHGVNYTLSSEKFNREGYTQTGWSTADGDAKAYDMGGTYSTDEAKTFYPFWTANEYTITYKDKDDAAFSGVHGNGYPTTHTYGTVTALVNPTKAGYTFDGWYDNAACTGTALTEIGATAYTADFTLYAKWTIKSNCTIRWVNYNDTLLYESTIQREGIPYYPDHLGTPTRLGDDNRTYTFKGWSPDIHAAYDDETYTAQYSMSITTGEQGAYTVSGTEDAVATTVQVTGALHVPEGKSLTTGDLIVEAYSDGSGTIDGLERVTVTGNAYFDYNFNTDPWHWSAFGVPFEIDLKAVAPLKETTTPMVLGSDYDIVYYDSDERAAHGPSGKCWKYVENDAEHKLTPGKLYMIAFNRPVGHVDVVRFTKANSAVIDYTADVPLSTSGTGDNNNWNGIANPKMFHALLNAGVTECQVHDGGEIGKDGYHTYIMDNKKFFVGKAAFVQVPNEQSVMTTTQATDQSAIVAKAPRRAKAQEVADRYDVQIAPMAEEMSDRVFLLTDEDKADEYVIVSDLAKAGVSPVRPQMWVNRYGVKLCKNTVAMRENIADYPLGISVPADGDYDIFLGERPNTDNMIYLTYDGEAIWNLSYGACTIELPRGTNDHYGLRVVAKSPQVATGIEEATIQNGDAVRKVIVEDKVFIIRNGQVYSIDGRLAK